MALLVRAQGFYHEWRETAILATRGTLLLLLLVVPV